MTSEEWAHVVRKLFSEIHADGHTIHLLGDYGADADLVIDSATVETSTTIWDKGLNE